MRIVRCALSGSYHRDVAGVQEAYQQLARLGCQILSPHRLNIADAAAAFVKDSAESDRSADAIEKHHLLAISQSDFVWLHCQDGYVGPSAALEIGFAYACNVPVFAYKHPEDEGLAWIVQAVPHMFAAIELVGS